MKLVVVTYLVTLLLTLLVVGFALWGFVRFGTPVYHLERVNLIALLELVQAGKATPADWDVFMAVPIRHDPELAEVQHRCAEIAAREYLGYERRLFTEKGLQELAEVLTDLRAMKE